MKKERRELDGRWQLGILIMLLGLDFCFYLFFCKDWLTHKEREQWDYFVIGLGYRYLQLD